MQCPLDKFFSNLIFVFEEMSLVVAVEGRPELSLKMMREAQ